MQDSHETAVFLARRHPDYESRLADWEFFHRSYLGGAAYRGCGALFSHRLEHPTDFRRRLDRSYYLNHCRNVVDKMTALLFSKGVRIDPAPPDFLDADANRRGDDLVQVMRRAATLSSIFGHVFVLVDMPRVDGEPPQTRGEELLLGIRPYLSIVSPTDVTNWEIDESGAVAWCVIRETIGQDGVEAGGQVRQTAGREEVYRLWTRDAWFLYAQSAGRWVLADQGVHGLGVVPIVSVRHRDLDGGIGGESLLRDVAVINREIFNLSSLLQEILYRQTFGQLVAQGSAEEYVGEEETLSKLGTSSIFLYPDGREAPRYISPQTGNAEIVVEQIDRMVDEIYRITSLQPPDRSPVSGAPESGLARSYRFVDTTGILRDKADAVADAFERALWIASVWEGRDQEYAIRFPEPDPAETADDTRDAEPAPARESETE